MPLYKMRILSLLIIFSVISAMVGRDFGLSHLLIYLAVVLPLWFPINLDAVRDHRIWKHYAYLSFLIFIGTRLIGVPFKSSLFFLILFCIVYELYGEKRIKAPLRLLSLLSFLFVISQLRQTHDLRLFVSMTIYLSGVVLCLMLFHLRDKHILRTLYSALTAWPRTLIHALIIFVLALNIYWVVPRMPDQGTSMIGTFSGKRISGFSDRVSLNDIGSLKLSRKHILDITPLDGTLHSRYLKGKVLDQYRKGEWTTSSLVYYFRNKVPGRYNFSDQPLSQKTYSYRIDVEPLRNNPVFFFDHPIELTGQLKPLKIQGGVNQLDQIVVDRMFATSLSYTLVASPEAPKKETLANPRPLLRIPKEQTYFKQIGDEVLLGEQDLKASQIVAQFMSHFSRNFDYSLDIDNLGAKDPLKEFMLKKRAGHCELFASSMVMMLRAQGLPSRLVIGFLVSNKHFSGEFYSVTEADAHAWVEVFYDDKWHTVDPTPPASFVQESFLGQQVRYLNWLWRSKVILWDFDRQKTAFTDLGLALNQRMQQLRANGINPSLLVFVIGLLGLVGWFLAQFSYRVGSRLTHRYRILIQRLHQRFGPLNPSEPLLEFIARLPMEEELRTELLHFVSGYQRWRFRGSQNTAQGRALLVLSRAVTSRLKANPRI